MPLTGRTKSVKPPVLKNPEPPFRPSFTPNLFSSFEQFEMSLKRVAARADSAHRKRKHLGQNSEKFGWVKYVKHVDSYGKMYGIMENMSSKSILLA